MIKLPIILAGARPPGRTAVNGAIAERAPAGAGGGEGEPDYIRPIVLFQAQPKKRGSDGRGC